VLSSASSRLMSPPPAPSPSRTSSDVISGTGPGSRATQAMSELKAKKERA